MELKDLFGEFNVDDEYRPETEQSPKYQTNNLDVDRFEKRTFEEIVDASENMQKLCQDKEVTGRDSEANIMETLANDVWSSFYQMEPKLVDEEKVSPLYLPNRKYVEKLMESDDFEELRVSTRLDQDSSALAAMSVMETINQELRNSTDPDNPLKQSLEAASPGKSQSGEDAEKTVEKIKNSCNSQNKSIKSIMKQALARSKELNDKKEMFMNAWGSESEPLGATDPKSRFDMIKRMSNPRVAKIISLMGRMKNLANNKIDQNIRKQGLEIHDVSLGDNLSRLIPSELVKLNHPALKKDFQRRFLDKSLLQYELKSKEPSYKGPIVVCVDCSGSMNSQTPNGNTRMDEAVSLALALVNVAHRQKRPATIFFFNTKVEKRFAFVPEKKIVISEILKAAGVHCSGGTAYEEILGLALDEVKSMKKDDKAADILMITDGECQLGSEEVAKRVLDHKKSDKTKIWRILVGGNPRQQRYEVFDTTWLSNCFDDDKNNSELFQKILI